MSTWEWRWAGGNFMKFIDRFFEMPDVIKFIFILFGLLPAIVVLSVIDGGVDGEAALNAFSSIILVAATFPALLVSFSIFVKKRSSVYMIPVGVATAFFSPFANSSVDVSVDGLIWAVSGTVFISAFFVAAVLLSGPARAYLSR